MKKWPLAINKFSFVDKLKLCSFILSSNRFTMGERVEIFEEKVSKDIGEACLFTSSGSTANHLLVETHKQTYGRKLSDVVICPSTTWVSSVTPWQQAGYKVDLCDINLLDFSFDYNKLEEKIKAYHVKSIEIIIFVTALIGFKPDIERLNEIKKKYKVKMYLDSCESTFTTHKGKNICSLFDMSTTSTYHSHIVSSIEGGFLFTKTKELYETAKMIRSHGLTRSLSKDSLSRALYEADNLDVDSEFLFAKMGTNFRNTEINAFLGSLNWDKAKRGLWKRGLLFKFYVGKLFSSNRDNVLRLRISPDDVLFCLPVFSRSLKTLKEKLKAQGIEYRPIISGNLARQPCFKKYFNYEDFPNSEYLHKYGLYVGLNEKVTEEDIELLVSTIKGL